MTDLVVTPVETSKASDQTFKENLGLILHRVVDLIPFRYEEEWKIFHNAVDNIENEVESLFKPIPQATTIGDPNASLAAKVDELTKLVEQLTQAQVTDQVTAPVAVPVTVPVTDPVADQVTAPVTDPVIASDIPVPPAV